MKHFILPAILLLNISVFAQITDSFTDENFTSNPAWTGDVANFQVNNEKRLQLSSSGSGSSFLATPSTLIDSIEWNFWLNLNFSPSNQNNVSIYLVSDQQDLKSGLNGYLIKIGENGSNDAIDLVRQDGNTFTTIIHGADGRAAGSSNELRIKVVRDHLGNWELFSDTTGTIAYVKEGDALDNTYTSTAWFGWVCDYTTSNATKFYLDEVYAGPERIDKDAPEILSAVARNATTILAHFSEQLDPATVTATNFRIPGNGSATSASLETDGTGVELQFPQPLVNKNSYELIVNGIKDLSGNILSADTATFFFFLPEPGDIVLNELFPDFTPKIGLPEAEFAELFNASAFAANLNGWSISDGTSTASLPEIVLQPDSFLILTTTSNDAQFQPFGRTAGLSGFPTLNNTGDDIVIRDATGEIMERITYDTEWYHDESKEDGGWTLERINPYTSCGGNANWRAAVHPAGGTPGTMNSVLDATKDTTVPSPVSVEVLDSISLRVQFSEDLDSAGLGSAYFSAGSAAIADAWALQPGFNPVYIVFAQPLDDGIPYRLLISGTSDCEGNVLTDTLEFNFSYHIPKPAELYDILIHEIMFKPDPPAGLPEAEYVELLNRSDKPISLKGWTLSDPSDEAVLPDFLLLPDSFLILTQKSTEDKFPGELPVSGLVSFPLLNNAGDSLVIADSTGKVVLAVAYQAGWIKDGLKEDGGWSLEMIDKDNPCGGKENWRGSTDPRGGTPGTANSVEDHNPDVSDPDVLRITVRDSVTLEVIFTEPMNPESFSAGSFELSPYMGNPVAVEPQPDLFISQVITFATHLERNQIYELTVTDGRDCAGNEMVQNTSTTGLPEPADSLDLVLNELLFNPRSGGVDFVELYNRSKKIIDLKSLLVSSLDDELDIEDPKEITLQGYLLFPGEYVVLTTDPEIVKEYHNVPYPPKMLRLNSLPSMPDAEGTVVVLNRQGLRIDQFSYNHDMHYALLKDENGVSLERIDPDGPSQDASNWFSAAATAAYATPTFRNSQFKHRQPASKPYTIDPPVFSPDLDGFQDLLKIRFSFAGPGQVINVNIYDLNGRPIKELAENLLGGTEGTITWDGVTNDGRRAAKGVYILYIEIFDLDGNVERHKENVTLAVREN
ncbi:MAG: lamin tail domain-containing protein [Bacteroidia bacterium]